MTISVLHLSDIHIQIGRNIILNRQVKLFDSIKNEIKGSDGIVILTSGDIAFSGKAEEYNIAVKLYKYLYKSIEKYTDISSRLIFVPGNHDLLFNEEEEKVRKLILKDFSSNGFGDLSDNLINICCKPQENYFDFVNKIKLRYNGDVILDHKLLKIINFKFGDKIIKFNCYNSAWHSLKKEQIGTLGFPIDYLNESIPNISNDLSISIVHHPFNWQSQETSKKFREFLASSSEIIITGHEHQKDASIFSDLENTYSSIHIESPALQDTDNERNSSFNLIKINIAENKLQIKNFEYNNTIGDYNINNSSEWKKFEKFKKLKNKDFQLNKDFLDELQNPGASFSHSTADEIKLNDIYIPCTLNNITVSKEKKARFQNFISSNIAFEIKEGSEATFQKVVFGYESSGKSSLLKHLYLKFYQQGFYPILLKGEIINEIKVEKLKTLLNREFKKQYDELDSRFEKIDFDKIVILIDDFHRFKHKPSRPAFIHNLNKLFNKIIITGNELMQFESYTENANGNQTDIFDSFDRFMIQEFGPTLRFKLINTWFRLGKEYIDNGEKNDFLRKVDQAQESISTIIGKNLMPAYPIYMLSILQALETGQHDTANSLHGYYYEMLITKALKNALEDKDEIGFYITLAKEYFFFLFTEKIRFSSIHKNDFNSFLEAHCKKYNLDSINNYKVFKVLSSGKILKEVDKEFVGVTYKYIYYYFVAKYLADNLEEQNNKDIVDRMSDRVYREEYSNIILFLSHLSRNKFIIDKLIEKSRKIFEDQQVIKLETDVDFINRLQKTLPEQVLKNLDVDTARLEDLKDKEEYEVMERDFEENKHNREEYDLNEDVNTIDILAKLTKAVRTINILGHITRKSWGELIGPYKMDLAEETFLLGLRTLKFNFSLLNNSQDALIEHIKSIIHKRFIKQNLSKSDIENISTNFIFSLSTAASFGIVKRVANSIGSQKLSKTFDDIENKHPFNSVRLINTGIKLDHYSTFPLKELEVLKKHNEKNPLGFAVLQNLVTDHLYLYEVPYNKKQQVCNLLNIKISDQRYINSSSPIKKEGK